MTIPGIASRVINRILDIKPIANVAKHQARQMMINRAERIGVPWRDTVAKLQEIDWSSRLEAVQNAELTYPDYYLRSFHAYDRGNLCWEAALEVDVAAKAVHSRLWPDAGADGDRRLRQTYHQIVSEQLSIAPQDILDIGCSTGLSTFLLQEAYPDANITGLDLCPYFLSVAQYNAEQRQSEGTAPLRWIHAPGEDTGLPDESFDRVSVCLVCHELPQSATRKLLHEVRRLLRPQGHLTFMDMNPRSEVYAKMPPYILTLLKSTEPYLDEYFSLDLAGAMVDAGFATPYIQTNTARHRTVIAQRLE